MITREQMPTLENFEEWKKDIDNFNEKLTELIRSAVFLWKVRETIPTESIDKLCKVMEMVLKDYCAYQCDKESGSPDCCEIRTHIERLEELKGVNLGKVAKYRK